ncbi:MAG: ATP-dependent chaperone ClpB [Parcubacteria group bacterium GW2011_GWA1_54_9]|nr:MAG: ATP-dependent chaperone ClpB [Parcubacteria group bacterium GW2011_GWA1_54_9]
MPPFNNFTTKAKEAVRRAHELAIERGQNHVSPLHLLAALVLQEESLVFSMLDRMEVDTIMLADAVLEHLEAPESATVLSPSYQIYLTPDLAQALEASGKIAARMNDTFVGTEHLFLAVVEHPGPASDILARFSIGRDAALAILKELKSSKDGQGAEPKRFRALAKYARNLTKLAAENKLDPVIGRDLEINRVIQILARRTKNNPVLIGEAGVGKTAIAEGLAARMATGDKAILFVDELHTLVGAGGAEGSLDASNMLKPALSRGELRVIGATTLKEYQKYIEKDAALTRRFQSVFVQEPSVEDGIAILRGLRDKYELFHGVRITDGAIVAAVELSARYISDRFLPDKAIDLIDEAASGLRIALENKPPLLEETDRKIRRLEIERQALQKDAEALASVGSGPAPGGKEIKERIKAIDSEVADLKEKTSELELKWKNEKDVIAGIRTNKTELEALKIQADNAEASADLGTVNEEVTEQDIAGVVSRWTGIPVARMLEEEAAKLGRMEESLKKSVIGQDNAVAKVTDAVKRSRVGISDPNRPIGSFLFLGPTGVGKTELSKKLAEFMFNDADALVRVDMSEFMEKHSVAKLIGAPPGYVGYEEAGTLTERIRHRPYAVVLFDEIEKAHPEVFNILLQVLDSGHLTDGKGRKVNFKNTIIVLTSNIGGEFIDRLAHIGFGKAGATDATRYEETKEKVMDALKEHFRPEFLNRLDDIIIFDVLAKETLARIVNTQIEEVMKRLSQKRIALTIEPEVRTWLAEKGYNPQYGARPLRRTIQDKILTPLASLMVVQDVMEGGTVTVSIKNDIPHA